MSDRVFTLLLSLTLALQDVCAEFQVWTLLQYNFKDNSSVNIICQPDVQTDWKMGARLFINDEDVCHSDKNNTICEERKQGNQFIFTLKITAKNTRLVYQCEIYKRTPLPIVKRRGEKAELLTECSVPRLIPETPPTTTSNCTEEVPECHQPDLLNLLTLALLGFVFLLCLYSLIMTVAYIKLRIKISDDLTITYVPMQQNGIRPKKKAKGHGADKNAEYMDMREVHHHTQPLRDMNHNSRLNPVGSSV
ncbi:uncharacterized protein si:ch211-67e16.3 isoform X1 [Clarias gariepinus]|uniref:uncharacterized protein si:ch211-67e16.3 isoform X1 n=1 Tax=Clarias gariepinus TaxID=13013 RepID=UPI00234CC351|nr:uncharacterized protein si:ch211-67e16.3 isoform X1 [Clarias gariepinus]